MEAVAILIGLMLFAAYIAAAIYLTKLSNRLLAVKSVWLRNLSSAVVLAVFFAPGFVAGGHGAAVGPAWLAVLDPESNRFIVRAALISLAVSWSVFFIGGIAVHRIRKHQNN